MGEKIRFTKAIKIAGKKYTKNDTAEFTEQTVNKLVNENSAAVRINGEEEDLDEVEELGEVEELDKDIDNDSGANYGIDPELSRFIGISDSRNLRIKVFPPEWGKQEYDSPTVIFEESRKDENGDWDSESVYMPTGSNLLAAAKAFEDAYAIVQELRD